MWEAPTSHYLLSYPKSLTSSCDLFQPSCTHQLMDSRLHRSKQRAACHVTSCLQSPQPLAKATLSLGGMDHLPASQPLVQLPQLVRHVDGVL